MRGMISLLIEDIINLNTANKVNDFPVFIFQCPFGRGFGRGFIAHLPCKQIREQQSLLFLQGCPIPGPHWFARGQLTHILLLQSLWLKHPCPFSNLGGFLPFDASLACGSSNAVGALSTFWLLGISTRRYFELIQIMNEDTRNDKNRWQFISLPLILRLLEFFQPLTNRK